jgi:drug/metabolite transporter (DMT)-like permease
VNDPRLRAASPVSPFLLAVLAALLFALAPALGKALLAHIGPATLSALLYLGAAAGVLPVLAATRRLRSPLVARRTNRLRLAGAILCGGVLGPLAFVFGLRLASAASVSLWLNGEAAATAVLGALFFRDPLGRNGWLAVGGVVLAGTALAVGDPASGYASAALIGVACVAWGLDNHWSALIDELTPLETTLWKGIAAGTFTLALAIAAGEPRPEAGSIGGALLLGALAYGASIALYVQSAQLWGAVRSQLVFASSPFLAALLAAALLGEPLRWVHGAAALAFAGSWLLLARERHEHLHRHEAMTHEHWHRHDDGHHLHVHPGLPASHGHLHAHRHEPVEHTHPHRPDLHHRHGHPAERDAREDPA